MSELVGLSNAQLLAECRRILDRQMSLPGDLPADEPFAEGAVQQVLVNRYERAPGSRESCVAHYGPTCVVCGFNFAAAFGPLAEGFICVHHLTPLSEVGAEYVVDPIAELRPVFPSCHATIQLGGVTRSVDEVKQLLAQWSIALHPPQLTRPSISLPESS